MGEQGYRHLRMDFVQLPQPELFQIFWDRSVGIEEIAIAISQGVMRAICRGFDIGAS